jgi:hypothetical protein
MLSAGAGAGTSPGAAEDPRVAVETAVSAVPDDPSDKLNLAINNASVSATDIVLRACLTSVCRSGANEVVASHLTPPVTPIRA